MSVYSLKYGTSRILHNQILPVHQPFKTILHHKAILIDYSFQQPKQLGQRVSKQISHQENYSLPCPQFKQIFLQVTHAQPMPMHNQLTCLQTNQHHLCQPQSKTNQLSHQEYQSPIGGIEIFLYAIIYLEVHYQMYSNIL